MKITAKDVLDLRERLNSVKIEKARLQERRDAAVKAQQEALDKLKALGFEGTPDEICEELEDSYDRLVFAVSTLEDAVGLTRPAD